MSKTGCLKTLTGTDYIKYALTRITKGHNIHETVPVAPIFLNECTMLGYSFHINFNKIKKKSIHVSKIIKSERKNTEKKISL